VTQFADTDDERYLRETVRSVMGSIDPLAGARVLADDPQGFAMGEWLRLATELGLAGLLIPDEYGGAGAPLCMAGVVLEECGRRLYGGPFLSSGVLAPLLLLACDGDRVAAARTGDHDGARMAPERPGQQGAARHVRRPAAGCRRVG
jgi:alkylation response protein AidB-like acyl-CoA dehydrogenase